MLSAAESELLRGLVRSTRGAGGDLTGPDGLLKHLTKTVIESALEEELVDHLGDDKHDPVGRNGANQCGGPTEPRSATQGHTCEACQGAPCWDHPSSQAGSGRRDRCPHVAPALQRMQFLGRCHPSARLRTGSSQGLMPFAMRRPGVRIPLAPPHAQVSNPCQRKRRSRFGPCSRVRPRSGRWR